MGQISVRRVGPPVKRRADRSDNGEGGGIGWSATGVAGRWAQPKFIMRLSDERFICPAGDALPENLAALWARDPTLALRVEQSLLDDVTPATTPTPLPDGFDSTAGFAHLVEGCGPAVLNLFERTGGKEGQGLILAAVPTEAELGGAMQAHDWSDAVASGRLHFIVGEDAHSRRLDDAAAVAPLFVAGGFTTIAGRKPDAADTSYFARVRERLADAVRYHKTNLDTTVHHGRKTAVNLMGNLREYATNPGLSRLTNAFAGKPAVLVSAGPSLRKNVERLRGREGEFVIVAVQTALKPLLAAGVVPQFVCSLDHHEVSTRFYADLPADLPTELVAEPKAASATLRAWRSVSGRKLTLLGNDYCESLLRELSPSLSKLPAGATVAHLAFSLIEHLGCSTAILIGQDLGFSDGLAYAPGTGYDDAWRPETGRFCTFEMKQWEHIARDRGALLRVKDYQGNWTYTEKRLASYLQRFEQMFAETPMRVIDATEGGVSKQNAETMPLADALAQCATGSTGTVPPHPGERVTDARFDACLTSRVREADLIADVSRRTLPLLGIVRDHPGDAGRVNAAVAKIDALRREIAEDPDADRTYNLVTTLTQHSERDRVLADARIAACGGDETEQRRQQADRDLANVAAIEQAAGDLARLLAHLQHDEPRSVAA